MPVILSICIPTFNRGGFIGATLQSILSQHTPEVEIVIVDGGSTDNTAEVVAGYSRRHGCIKYYPQKTNAGVDRDIDRSVQLATGSYCWLMSSDDLLRPGAIRAVLDACAGNYSLIVVNSEIRDCRMSRVLSEKVLSTDSDQIYAPSEWGEFFLRTANYLTYLGAVIIQRELWLSRPREPYLRSDFVHVGVIFQAPPPDPVMVIAHPQVSIRYGNFTWGPRSADISLLKWPRLVWSLDALPAQLRQRVYPRGGWRFILRLFYHRAFGRLSSGKCARYFTESGLNRAGRLLAQMGLLIPVRIMNFLAFMYFSRVRRDRANVYLLETSPTYWLRPRRQTSHIPT